MVSGYPTVDSPSTNTLWNYSFWSVSKNLIMVNPRGITYCWQPADFCDCSCQWHQTWAPVHSGIKCWNQIHNMQIPNHHALLFAQCEEFTKAIQYGCVCSFFLKNAIAAAGVLLMNATVNTIMSISKLLGVLCGKKITYFKTLAPEKNYCHFAGNISD